MIEVCYRTVIKTSKGKEVVQYYDTQKEAVEGDLRISGCEHFVEKVEVKVVGRFETEYRVKNVCGEE